MPKIRTRCYSIEIRDAQGSILFSTIADWDDKEKRSAVAQIMRLAALPEVNVYTKPALEPPPVKRDTRRRPGG